MRDSTSQAASIRDFFEPRRGEALRAYWLAPQGLIMLAATGLALAIRLYLLSRLRYLTGITEYDDGVYLGGAVSLLSGAVPYRDFAFIQPANGRAKVCERVISSPRHTKRLLNALAVAVQRYESAFGVLETDVRKRVKSGT